MAFKVLTLEEISHDTNLLKRNILGVRIPMEEGILIFI